ncbi:two-component system sensor histidine kinase CreC [Pseudoduganella namucuonensis]|uniref:histidine kinase n=1 Tax=Pseudoduganella namucuonensis TaxID=1035707 RepID=A0A1I7KFL0_9BURK|nr:two-component system sensor histidine kinase CreC [Pseudoduganella namucuonensis]SFU96281.1 signal transduction histidine kinase [Pseudoduganella namucuonensis]
MRIGLRILLGYLAVVGLAAWFLFNVFVAEVKPGVRATQEDTLVDTAYLLATVFADDVKAGTLQSSAILPRMRAYARRDIDASISGVAKRSLDYRVYITDAKGIVLFDSDGRDVGKDYSRWNDVYLTLRGKYGARSTRSDPDDEASTVMHVAAPILDGGKVIGVLTVAKPNASVQAFVERGQQNILRRGAVLLALSLLIGVAVAWWLSRALGKLMTYVADVEAGRKAALPDLGNNEIATLGRALEAMRTRLEGKEYAERLMHTLAHELKSPIAAIQASAELLREEMPEQDRKRFLGNVLEQNARQRQLIDKLLALVRVEQRQRLDVAEPVELRALAGQVAADFAPQLAARGQRVEIVAGPALTVRGDALLLRQALGNLLDNAIAFAPRGGTVRIELGRDAGQAIVSVRDDGPGIPAYAMARLFERFYSLPRPDSGKSTGLGLPFAREVAALHGGAVTVENAEQGGCRATLALPLPLSM